LVALRQNSGLLLVPLLLELLDLFLLQIISRLSFLCPFLRLLLEQVLLALQIFSLLIKHTYLLLEVLVIVFGLLVGLVKLGELLAVVF